MFGNKMGGNTTQGQGLFSQNNMGQKPAFGNTQNNLFAQKTMQPGTNIFNSTTNNNTNNLFSNSQTNQMGTSMGGGGMFGKPQNNAFGKPMNTMNTFNNMSANKPMGMNSMIGMGQTNTLGMNNMNSMNKMNPGMNSANGMQGLANTNQGTCGF